MDGQTPRLELTGVRFAAPTPDPQARRRLPPNLTVGFRGGFSEVKPMSIPWWFWILGLIENIIIAGLAMSWGKAHPTIQAKVAEDIKAAAQKIGLGG